MIPVLLLIAVLLSAGCTGAFSGMQDTVPATPVSSGSAMNQTPDTCTYVQLTTNSKGYPLVSLLSSYLPFGRTSTVGDEVLFLRDGYRSGRYPPGISSRDYFRPDRTGVRAGWNSFGNQGLPDERNAGRTLQDMPPGRMANQVTMQVVMVDETAHAEYATIWLTPSARIYTLAKNIPDYRTSIGLMEQSIKDGSFLTFTLDTQESPQGFSIITRVAKGVQPPASSQEEKAVPVAQPVPIPDGMIQAPQITMHVIMVDETAHAEYTTVWLDRSARIYTLPKNIPDYRTSIGLMEQSIKDGSFLTFTLDTQESPQGFSIITRVAKGVQPAASSPEEKAAQVTPPASSPG